jgi:SAM-dependent methyltransferase
VEQGIRKRPLHRRIGSHIRRWTILALFGGDLRVELKEVRDEFAELRHELAKTRDQLHQEELFAKELLERTDILFQRLDRKAEWLFGALSRELRGEPESAFFTGSNYLLFEQRFRGEEEETRMKLALYVDLFESGPVVDLGCGRGELVQLLGVKGIVAYGVDTNEAMVERCRSKGLEVYQEDLFAHLGGLDSGVLGGIVATQVIEHLWPAQVQHLLIEAFRVLRAGGRIVLETPNPASVWGFMQNWIRDPTHRWAIHADTLKFMAEQAGFQVAELVFTSRVPDEERLQEEDPDAKRLNEFLYGPQDYALVADRPKSETRLG